MNSKQDELHELNLAEQEARYSASVKMHCLCLSLTVFTFLESIMMPPLRGRVCVPSHLSPYTVSAVS